MHDIVQYMPASTEITVVTERGQTSIPARLRKELALAKGQRLLWERTGDRELRIVILEHDRPRGARAMLGFARQFRPEARSTEDWMADLRAGEAEPEGRQEE